MTRERMEEIALLMVKAALKESDDWDREVEDMETAMISRDIGISGEEVKEFMKEICKEVGEERDGE